jgi:hypothetical protein
MFFFFQIIIQFATKHIRNFTSGKILHKKEERKEGPPPKQSYLVPSSTIEGGEKVLILVLKCQSFFGLDFHKLVDDGKHLPFLWFSFLFGHTIGERTPLLLLQRGKETMSPNPPQKTMETSFQVFFLLSAIIKNHFCLYFGYPAGTC